MADQFLAEIRCFGFNFAPIGWAQCQGQLLSISQNSALFSLIGTYYGGNGTSNFQLPNLQGIVPIGQGQGPGLTDFVIGETSGEMNHTLLLAEMPMHNHNVPAKAGPGATPTPVAGSMLAEGHAGGRGTGVAINHYTTATRGTTLNPAVVGPVGSGQAHPNNQPSLTMNWCIALQGIFPARN
jgi:microcystin-dependent protein